VVIIVSDGQVTTTFHADYRHNLGITLPQLSVLCELLSSFKPGLVSRV